MKHLSTALTASALTLAATPLLNAQEQVLTPRPMLRPPIRTPQTPANPGLVNTWLREKDPAYKNWDIGGQLRLRYENFEGASPAFPNRDFQRTGVDNNNEYLFLREKLHIGYTSMWFSAYLEGINSDGLWDKDPRNPGTDRLDLNQAFVIIGNNKEFPVTLKAGRQELIYGDERLIGAGDWSNTVRAFDAIKIRYENEKRWIDLFTGRPVLIDNHNFNVVDDYDWFSGIYFSDQVFAKVQQTQFYILSRNASSGTAAAGVRGTAPGVPQNSSAGSPRDIVSIGARVKSLPGKLGGWDYSAESVSQYGSINVGGRRVSHEASAMSIGGGYTWKRVNGAPRLGFEYNFATGDRDPNDDKNTTFDNLFPTNHKHYGYMDYVGWRNIHNPRLSLSLKPDPKVTLSIDGHGFWLADDRDSFYPQAGAGRSTDGYGRNSSFSKFLGTELDVDATYNWKSWMVFRAGYGHFFVGDYIESSKASVGGASDANWVYVQTTLNF